MEGLNGSGIFINCDRCDANIHIGIYDIPILYWRWRVGCVVHKTNLRIWNKNQLNFAENSSNDKRRFSGLRASSNLTVCQSFTPIIYTYIRAVRRCWYNKLVNFGKRRCGRTAFPSTHSQWIDDVSPRPETLPIIKIENFGHFVVYDTTYNNSLPQ